MSRRLSAVALGLGILVGAMGLKTIVMSHSSGTVLVANGPAPLPNRPQKPPTTGTSRF